MKISNDEVLGKKYRPAMKLLGFLGSVVVIMWQLIAWDTTHARAAAMEVARPVEQKLDEHLAMSRPMVFEMRRFAEEQRHAWGVTARNQYKICLKLRLDCEQP